MKYTGRAGLTGWRAAAAAAAAAAGFMVEYIPQIVNRSSFRFGRKLQNKKKIKMAQNAHTVDTQGHSFLVHTHETTRDTFEDKLFLVSRRSGHVHLKPNI